MVRHLSKANASYINRINKIKVLNLIRDKKAISRADIAKITDLSAPTVTRIVDSLINTEHLVVEIGMGNSNGGRPPNLVEFDGENNYVIGIDLGATNIYGVLTNLNAEIISEIKIPTFVQSGFEKVIERTYKVIEDLISGSGINKNKIYGIGMAVAGLVNRQKYILVFSPDFHWYDVNIVGELSKRTDIPIKFDNVTRVMALGELWYGIGKKFNNFICVNIGYGIGAGIIIDGHPFYGTNGMAGEFGHITLEKDSDIKCDCGNYGCLEALASGHSIAAIAQEKLNAGAQSILLSICGENIVSITTEMIAEAAKEGDRFANEIFKNAAEYIGIGLSALINLYNPQAIVIGGGVSQAGDILFNPIKETITKRAISRLSEDVLIMPASYGMKATVMGAVSLILNEVLNLNIKLEASEKVVS